MTRLVVCFAFLSAFFSLGCAEGTTVVTGQQRAALDPEQVRLYSQPPSENFEVIAMVRASSGNGLTDQQSVDFAIQELKNQAAAVGANGVVLTGQGSQVGNVAIFDNFASFSEEQTVSGNAIYVAP